MSGRSVLHRACSSPRLVTVGHWAWPVPLGLAVGLRLTAHTPAEVATWGLPMAGGLLVVAAHSAALLSCARCRFSLAPPTDAEDARAQVARYGWLLRAAHAPWLSLALWALASAGLTLTFTVDGRLQPLSALPVAAFYLLYLLAGPRAHTRLQPVCPWCNHDRGHGGPGEGDPAPLPDGPDGDRRPAGALVVDEVPAVTDGRQVPDDLGGLLAEWETAPAVHEPLLAPVRSRRSGRPVPGQRRDGAR